MFVDVDNITSLGCFFFPTAGVFFAASGRGFFGRDGAAVGCIVYGG